MISRYTRPEMGALWTEESEFRAMLDVEIYACEIMAELGEIPKEAVPVIREKADFTIERIKEIERETRHDILAFTQALAENVGPEGKYIHKGLTSSDVKDTALGYLMMKSCDLILKGLQNLDQALLKQAITHRKTPQMGRTHGVHAEPTTFGLKCLLWLSEVRRDIRRMEQARETVAVGKISGAVGTYSNISPKVEEHVCEKMGLKAAMISTQIIQRDRHAVYFTTLAIVAATLEKIALEIRHLQRTEVREAEEFFHAGQKGSSAMPHKRNPITCERICGLARLVRSNAQAALENVALWHERDISHSSVERVILPDSSITVDYMLHLTTGLVDKLLVYPDRMMKNIELTGGLFFSQRILVSLVAKGAIREEAYRWVQRNAMACWQEGKDFKAGCQNDQDIQKFMTSDEVAECFDLDYLFRHVDVIYSRFGL